MYLKLTWYIITFYYISFIFKTVTVFKKITIMNPKVRNILAVLAGWLGGSSINMGLVKVGHILFPIADLDPNDLNSIAEIMPTLDYRHFIFPFLAHALGTLTGAFIAGMIAAKNKMKFALVIGVLFLIGGILINYIVPGPIWFIILDLVAAYLPMAWIGGLFTLKFLNKN